jgi:hypothetical protein
VRIPEIEIYGIVLFRLDVGRVDDWCPAAISLLTSATSGCRPRLALECRHPYRPAVCVSYRHQASFRARRWVRCPPVAPSPPCWLTFLAIPTCPRGRRGEGTMLNHHVGQLTTQRPSRTAPRENDDSCSHRRVSVPTTFLLASEPESAVFSHHAKLLDPGT